MLWLMATTSAQATDVAVVGLFPGKAMISIDGAKPRMLSAGETGAANVKLISATSDAAVIEINGKRQTLTLGEGVTRITGNYAVSGRPKVVLNADKSGHYLTTGSINGGSAKFLVDTGATLVSLGLSDARRLGIQYLQGERGYSETANGTAPVYRVKLDSVTVGGITLNNIDGVVHDGSDMPYVLLGMSFLGRLELKHEGQTLTMMQRY